MEKIKTIHIVTYCASWILWLVDFISTYSIMMIHVCPLSCLVNLEPLCNIRKGIVEMFSTLQFKQCRFFFFFFLHWRLIPFLQYKFCKNHGFPYSRNDSSSLSCHQATENTDHWVYYRTYWSVIFQSTLLLMSWLSRWWITSVPPSLPFSSSTSPLVIHMLINISTSRWVNRRENNMAISQFYYLAVLIKVW